MERLEYGIEQLHKKQKTNRIQAKEQERKANLILAGAVIGYIAFIVIGGLMTRY